MATAAPHPVPGSTASTEHPNPGSSSSTASDSGNQYSTFECNICLDAVKDAVVSLCGHLFCWPCLHQWLETRPNRQVCPVCKAGISRDKVIPLYGQGSTGQQDPRERTLPQPQGQRPEPENCVAAAETVRSCFPQIHELRFLSDSESWPCLHQWLETRPNRQVCPVCKAGISRDKVIPLYGQGSTGQQDPRERTLPQPQGQRPEPENCVGWFGFGHWTPQQILTLLYLFADLVFLLWRLIA